MNLILLFEKDFISENRVRLAGRRLAHVLQVHRAEAGDRLCVGLQGGSIGSGLVLGLSPEALDMEVQLDTEPPGALPATLLLALPRPKVLKRVLISATSMGVKRIYLLNSYRVEKSYWQSPVLSEQKLRETLVLGLEQAKDTLLPEVHLRKRFKPFVEDELPGIIAATTPMVAHPVAAGECPCDMNGPVTLAIGPEGGFIPYEVEKLVDCGFRQVSLGERILRVEAAVPALLGRMF